jgi:hypothetical protein
MRVRVRVRVLRLRRLRLRANIPPPIGFIWFVANPVILFDGLFKLFIILFI